MPKTLAQLAKDQVKAGNFTSVSEVVRTALRDFLVADVPTFKMSKQMEQKVDQALEEYKSGKLKPIHSLSELE